MNETNKMDHCPICNREFGGEMQDHHLKPRTFRSRTHEVLERDNLVRIHKVCHQKLHATFSEKEMFDTFHTVALILENGEIQKFVKWVRRKPPEFYDKNNDTKSRKQKRRR